MAQSHLDKPVRVTWTDARVTVDGAVSPLPIMTSYGIILYKDKEVLRICSLFGEDNEPRVVMSIPRSLILAIKKVV